MRKRLLSAAGVVCVGLGFLGVALPGLPTTPFLLLAGWCFARSDPELGKRLLAKPVFFPYRPFLDGTRPIPLRARLITIGIVCLTISLSLWLLHRRDALAPWLALLLVAAALVGTVVIWRFRPAQALSRPDPTTPTQPKSTGASTRRGP